MRLVVVCNYRYKNSPYHCISDSYMDRLTKSRKHKPTPKRSKLLRSVVKLHEDDFIDKEDAEFLRFDHFDDVVEY